MTERLPAPNGPRIRITAIGPGDLVTLPVGTKLVRVHPLGGAHALGWDEFRAFGPTTGRFDHQPPPPRRHRTRRVAYFTCGTTAFPTALGEFFQDDGGGIGPLDLAHRRPHVSVVEIRSPLRLLDLTAGWVTRAGGNQAIWSGARTRSRAWARAIYRHHRDIDGVAYRSSVWGPGRCIGLWERAERALPSTPYLHRSLDDAALAGPIATAAELLGTTCL